MAQELVSAAKSDTVAEVERILTDPKCNVNAYAGRLSPLQVTCSRGNLRIVKLLLKRGASLKTKDLFLDSARPPFLHAPKNARTHILKYFLELDNDLVQDTSDQKQTVLHFACENGDVASVDLLPKYNSKIYAKNTLKASPSQSCLLSASNKTGLEFSKMLVTAGYNLSVAESARNYLFYACSSPNLTLELFLFFLQHAPFELTHVTSKGECLLHRTTHPDVTSYLLTTELISQLNKFTSSGYTPLHNAVIRGKLDIVRILLNHKAELNPARELHKDIVNDKTILACAAECKNPEIFKLILSNNPLPFVSETTKESIFFRLAKHGPLEYFELLFDYYPESEFEKLYRNKTILGAAIDADKWEIATFIIEKIPDLANIKSRKVLPIQMGSYYFPGKLWYALTVHTLQKGLVWDQLSDQFSALFDEEYINSVKYLLYHHIRDCSRDIAGLRAARNRTLWCWVVKETDSFGGLLLKDLELTIRDYF